MNEEKKVFDKDEMNKNLERINLWISNCDVKISFALAFSGVLLGIFFTSNVINDSIGKFVHILKALDIQSFLIFTVTLFLIGFLTCLTLAIWFLFKGLKGSIDSSVYKQEGITTNSLLFFGTIKAMKFNKYKDEVKSTSDENLESDYLSQIHINATICDNKFSNYNIGLKFLVTSVILFVLLNVSFMFL